MQAFSLYYSVVGFYLHFAENVMLSVSEFADTSPVICLLDIWTKLS